MSAIKNNKNKLMKNNMLNSKLKFLLLSCLTVFLVTNSVAQNATPVAAAAQQSGVSISLSNNTPTLLRFNNYFRKHCKYCIRFL